jgi:hypothetical protein
MLAIEKTTRAFVASVREALPNRLVTVSRSKNKVGRSNYVYIDRPRGKGTSIKVRISDHAVGMRRALWGNEALFIHAGATIDHWSVWLGKLCAEPPPTEDKGT